MRKWGKQGDKRRQWLRKKPVWYYFSTKRQTKKGLLRLHYCFLVPYLRQSNQEFGQQCKEI